MGRKLGVVSLSGSGTWFPCYTMWLGLRPICAPSFIFIRPTVWPQYTNITDRRGQTDRQRSDSIGRTVLQTVAQKLKDIHGSPPLYSPPLPILIPPSLPSFALPPLPSPPCPPFPCLHPFPSFRSSSALFQLGDVRERCKLPQRGLGGAPAEMDYGAF